MNKANTQIIWLVLFSLLTAGVGQALLLTAASPPSRSRLADAASAQAQYVCVLPFLMKALDTLSSAR